MHGHCPASLSRHCNYFVRCLRKHYSAAYLIIFKQSDVKTEDCLNIILAGKNSYPLSLYGSDVQSEETRITESLDSGSKIALLSRIATRVLGVDLRARSSDTTELRGMWVRVPLGAITY